MKITVKRLTVFILAFVMLLTLAPSAAFAAAKITVNIDGYDVRFTESSGSPFINADSRTMVPLRITMETFGAEVSWDAKNKIAVVALEDTEVRVPIGQKCIYVNGEQIEIDTQAVIKNSRTYLPIRAVFEAFGAYVTWTQKTSTVAVDSQMYYCTLYQLANYGEVVSEYWMWKYYNAANEQLSAKSYKEAKDNLLLVLPKFASDAAATGSEENLGHIYRKLGLCFQNLGDITAASACYTRASQCYDRESRRPGVDAAKANNLTQQAIDMSRSAQMLRSSIKLYAVTDAPDGSGSVDFGLDALPANGILLGAYAEQDGAVHDSYGGHRRYWNEFEKLTGRKHGAYLLYFNYGDDLSKISSHIAGLKGKNCVLQLALQPINGMAQVNGTDGYLEGLAKALNKADIPVLLRFANEMNLTDCAWYTTPADYIEKFRTVADIIHANAPKVAMLWSPNYFPPDNIDSFYPGDEYVDVVGVSMYMSYNPSIDPLGQGVDRRRWVTLLESFYGTYGSRKPVIISEGAASYRNPTNSKDITAFASWQLEDIYAYLPVLYPNVRAIFYFDVDNTKQSNNNYLLSGNSAMLDAYSGAIQNASYVSEARGSSDNYYVKLGSSKISAAAFKGFAAFVDVADDTAVARAEYFVNDKSIGSTTEKPFTVKCDLSGYVGKTVTVRIKAYDAAGVLLAEHYYSAGVVK